MHNILKNFIYIQGPWILADGTPTYSQENKPIFRAQGYVMDFEGFTESSSVSGSP